MAGPTPEIAPYIPPTLARKLVSDPTIHGQPAWERFPATVLFADVSGFTPLTEALGQKGAEGPEELSRLLNHYFSHMIALVEAEGGEVVKFSGDALTVLFPAGDEPLGYATRRALQAAQAMQAAMGDFATLSTSVGPVALEMKIGLGAGQVLDMQVGGPERWEYAIAGDPLRQVAEAEGQARRGQIVLSPEASAMIHPEPLLPRPLVPPDWSAVQDVEQMEEILRSYVPRPVWGWLGRDLRDWLAVLRPMSGLFVGIDGLDYARDDVVERLHSWMRAALEVIFRYEGTLRQLAVDDKGTVVLVLFGAPPYAHEDDPLRAVRCAMDLQALTAASADAEAASASLQLAIGVTTGHVFAGPVGSEMRREYAAMGDTVNLSARLMGTVHKMGLAGAEAILCDFDTYRLARDQVAFKAPAPVRVKGKAGLIRIYRPVGPVDRRRPVEGRDTKVLVGRQAELSRLAAALDGVERGQSQVLLIEGEAGIGKSRLVEALTAMARQRGLTWLTGAGRSIEQQAPYRAWRDIFAYYFGLDRLGDADREAVLEERRHQVRRLVEEVAPDQLPRLALLNDILNLNFEETDLTASLDPELRQQSLFLLLVRLLQAWVRERPVILILEDAHWLDSLSWELVVYLARAVAASGDPLLIVLALRPPGPLGGQYLAMLRDLVDTETIDLPALDPKESVAVAAAGMGVTEPLPEILADLIRSRAGGNPFYAEELVFALRDQSLLRLEPEDGHTRCIVSPELSGATQTLPDTVQGLVLARIDRLSPERQLPLKVGAVIGRTFSYQTLRYTLHRHAAIDDVVLRSHLEALAVLDVVPLDTPEPELAYVFEHSITQEVAYQTLLFSQRRRLHQTVAAWYEDTFGEEALIPYYPLLVHHYHHAGVAERERVYARLAGEQAAAHFANAEAVRYLGRALELTGPEAVSERFTLLLSREQVYDLQGEREAQRRDLDDLASLAGRLDDVARQAEVALRRANYAEVTGDYPAAIAAARRAIDLVDREWTGPEPERAVEAVRLRAAGYMQWGRALWRQGDYEGARPPLEQSLSLARSASLRHLEAEALRNLGILSLDQGDYAQAQRRFEPALEICRQIGDRQGEGWALSNLGLVYDLRGDFAQATAYYGWALENCRQIGDRRGEANALSNLGVVAAIRGDYAAAKGYFEQALLICREIGDRQGESMALNNLGFASAEQGDYPAAKAYFEQVLQIFQQLGERRNEAMVWSNLGLLAHHLGDNHTACLQSERALSIAQELGDRPTEAEALTHLGHALVALGRLEEAGRAYRRAREVRQELGEQNLAVESLAGLVRVALARGDLDEARRGVEETLAFLDENTLDGTEEPFRVYLTCYRALEELDDPRAGDLLATAYRQLQERAGQISDEATRRAFLENVEAHREIGRVFTE